jgi:hypothetical protein
VRPASLLVRLAALLVPAVAVAAAPGARADDRVLVYVNDLGAPGALAADAAALTSALCSALAKDARVEVLCAPDVKQLLAFAATSSMLGTSPAADRLQQRLESARLVVTGRVAADGDDVVVSAGIGPRAAAADVGAMFFDAAAVELSERAPGKAGALLSRLPTFARRLVDGALTPVTQKATPTPPPPPEPLTPAPSTTPSKAAPKAP